jgi:hypothetical protein
MVICPPVPLGPPCPPAPTLPLCPPAASPPAPGLAPPDEIAVEGILLHPSPNVTSATCAQAKTEVPDGRVNVTAPSVPHLLRDGKR